MFIRIALTLFIPVFLGFAQSPFKSFTFGGSGSDTANGMTVDGSGNIYVVGATTSFDLPVVNAEQPGNSGTQLIYSLDAGATWKPLSSPLPGAFETPLLAVDPSNAQIVYLGSSQASSVCKSIDGGAHFAPCVSLSTTGGAITSLVVDPNQPSTLYATTVAPYATVRGYVFKSTDGGQTWISVTIGLPYNGFAGPITIDPFNSNHVYVWVGSGAYVSENAAATWSPSTLPLPAGTNQEGSIVFDPVTAGILYGPAIVPNPNPANPNNSIGFQKSVDGGQTWKPLTTPFSITCCLVPDPKVSGVLYALVPDPNTLWKSADGGATWNSFAVPSSATPPLVVDPSNPLIMLAGNYRSSDGGQTWTPTNASRAIEPAFAPSAPGTAYAVGPITSDAFLAKFLPDAKTLVFLTYFGGMGTDIGQSVALDGAGNIWIVGSTSSFDLPVTAGAFQTSLKGTTNGFVAKFTNDGKLAAATYLGGSNQDSVSGIALSPQGNPWVIGFWTSTDFPFAGTVPALAPALTGGFVGDFDAGAANVPFLAPVDGSFDAGGKGIAIDLGGNVIVTGSTSYPNFSVTAGAYHAGAPGTATAAFVEKLDPSGQVIYSTYLGGTRLPANLPRDLFESENAHQYGIAAATDSAGNVVLAGYTSATDFPTTPNAYQTTLGAGCPYPAFENGTGTIGIISDYLIDDVFISKLSADGTTLLSSTFLGGSCYDHPTGLALDAGANVYVTGETDSGDFPLADAVEPAPAVGQFSSFVSVLNAAESKLSFSTYLLAGATPSIAVAPASGSIVVAGAQGLGAQSQQYSGFPFPPLQPDTHVYLAALSPPPVAPALTLSQVRNAFSLQPGPVAPGEIVSLGLPGFVPAQFADIGLNVLAPMTTSLEGVGVSFDGTPAFLITVDFGKIVCIAPVGIAGQASTDIQVTVNGAMSNILNVSVAATAPGFLTASGTGTGLANARNADGTLNGPNNPAAAGTMLTLFLTGVGVTSPPEMDGVIPASSSIVPANTIQFFSLPAYNLAPPINALPGFVPGLFTLSILVPTGSSGLNNISVATQSVSVYFQ